MQTYFLKFLLTGIICLATISFVSGCHKKTAQEMVEQKALERHEHEAQQMNALRKGGWQKTSAGAPTLEAAKFVIHLLKSGQLPDIQDAKRSIQFNINLSATNYPLSRTFRLTMKSSSFVNHYTVVKNSAASSWQLTKAWRTDEKNNTVKTYSVDDITN